MSFGLPTRKLMQIMITFEAVRAAEMKFKTKHTEDAEKALVNMLITGFFAATTGVEDASYG